MCTNTPTPTAAPASRTSDLPVPPSNLSPDDRARLSLLFRTHGDAVAMCGLRGEEDPLELLHWLNQSHIKPWHDTIRAAHKDHRETETHLSLTRALKDITRILDLEADSTLRIRAVNAIIRLANAIHRHHRVRDALQGRTRAASDSTVQPRGASEDPSVRVPAPITAQRAAKELYSSQERAKDATYLVNLYQERRANQRTSLDDAKAPVGTYPSWARDLLLSDSAIADFPSASQPPRQPMSPHTNGAPHHSQPSHDSHQSHPQPNGHRSQDSQLTIETIHACPAPLNQDRPDKRRSRGHGDPDHVSP